MPLSLFEGAVLRNRAVAISPFSHLHSSLSPVPHQSRASRLALTPT